jgi:hypothetical protein
MGVLKMGHNLLSVSIYIRVEHLSHHFGLYPFSFMGLAQTHLDHLAHGVTPLYSKGVAQTP